MFFAVSSSITNTVIEREVEEIFQEEAYSRRLREYRPPEPLITVIKTIWDAIVSWIHGLSEKLGGLYIDSPVLFWLIFTGLLLVLVFLILHMAWSIRIAFRSRAAAPHAEDRVDTQQKRAASSMEQAETLAAESRYTEAVRLLFLVLLDRLADTEKGINRKSWTNHQIVNAITVPETQRSRLAAVAAAFDRGWYGQCELAAHLYRSSYTTINTLLQTLRKHVPDAGPDIEEAHGNGQD